MTAEALLGPEEQPIETVNRFIDLTRHPLIDDDSREYEHWVNEMSRVYGDQDLTVTNKDVSYLGIKDIKRILEDAYFNSGLDGMKAEFLRQTLTHTRLGRVDSRILEVILNFQ